MDADSQADSSALASSDGEQQASFPEGQNSLGSSLTLEQYGKELNCALCDTSFSTMNRRHHCRLCHKPVCGTCSVKGFGANKVRACKTCVTEQEEAHRQELEESNQIEEGVITTLRCLLKQQYELVESYKLGVMQLLRDNPLISNAALTSTSSNRKSGETSVNSYESVLGTDPDRVNFGELLDHFERGLSILVQDSKRVHKETARIDEECQHKTSNLPLLIERLDASVENLRRISDLVKTKRLLKHELTSRDHTPRSTAQSTVQYSGPRVGSPIPSPFTYSYS